MPENNAINRIVTTLEYIVAQEKRFIFHISRKVVNFYMEINDLEHDDLLNVFKSNNFVVNKPAQSSYAVVYHTLGDLIAILTILSRYGFRIQWNTLGNDDNTTWADARIQT